MTRRSELPFEKELKVVDYYSPDWSRSIEKLEEGRHVLIISNKTEKMDDQGRRKWILTIINPKSGKGFWEHCFVSSPKAVDLEMGMRRLAAICRAMERDTIPADVEDFGLVPFIGKVSHRKDRRDPTKTHAGLVAAETVQEILEGCLEEEEKQRLAKELGEVLQQIEAGELKLGVTSNENFVAPAFKMLSESEAGLA